MTSAWFERIVTGGLLVLLGAGLLSAVGSDVVGGVLQTWRTTGRDPALAHAGLLAVVLGAWLGAVALLGPMARNAADVAWVPGATPAAWVLPRLVGGSFLVALAVAWTFVVSPGRTYTEGAVGVAVLVGTSVTALLGQLADTQALLRGLARGLAIAGLGLLLWSADERYLGGALGALAVVAVAHGTVRTRPQRPGTTAPRWSLVRAAEQRWALSASLVLLDGSVARQARDRWSGPASLRPPRTGPLPTRAAVLIRRLLPTTVVLTVVAASVALVAAPWSSSNAAALVALLMAASTPRLCAAADRHHDAPALQRTYVATGHQTVNLAPTVALAVVGLVGAVAAGPSPLAGLLLIGLAPALVARRAQARRQESDQLIGTPFGPVPVAQADRMVAGWDVTVVLIVLLALT